MSPTFYARLRRVEAQLSHCERGIHDDLEWALVLAVASEAPPGGGVVIVAGR
jgi:hypothetical protein